MPPVAGFGRRQKLESLEALLPPAGCRLSREALLQASELSSADRELLLTRLAQEAPPSERYAAWERLSRAPVGSEAKAKALLEMAGMRRREGRHREAVLLLRRALDGDPRVAPDAQWQLALTLFSAGDYAGALEAFRRSEDEMPRHLCCHESHSTEYAIWEGLSLEHLGRTSDAISHYMSAIADVGVMAHVLDLYETANQFADFERAMRANTPVHPAAYGQIVPSLELLVMRRMARAPGPSGSSRPRATSPRHEPGSHMRWGAVRLRRPWRVCALWVYPMLLRCRTTRPAHPRPRSRRSSSLP